MKIFLLLLALSFSILTSADTCERLHYLPMPKSLKCNQADV